MMRVISSSGDRQAMIRQLQRLALDAEVDAVRINFTNSSLLAKDLLALPPQITRIELKLDDTGGYISFSRLYLFGIIILTECKAPEQARIYLDAVRAHESTHLEARAYYAECLRQLNCWQQAIVECLDILHMDPKQTMALGILYFLYKEQHDYVTAFRCLERLSLIMPPAHFAQMGLSLTPLQQALLQPLTPLPATSSLKIQDDTCSICLDVPVVADQVAVESSPVVLRVYHRACLFQWDPRDSKDPVTRQPIKQLYAIDAPLDQQSPL